MITGVYHYLIADDGIRQFALRMENDHVASITVFAENPADAKLRPDETVFARSDIYSLTQGALVKQNGFNATNGCTLATKIYKIKQIRKVKADTTEHACMVNIADCTHYCFGEVYQTRTSGGPFLGFTTTSLSRRNLRENGFNNYQEAILLAVPPHLLPQGAMNEIPDLPFDVIKTIPLPQATLAREGIELLLLPKAAPDPLWIAHDNKPLTHNYCTITKKLRKPAP